MDEGRYQKAEAVLFYLRRKIANSGSPFLIIIHMALYLKISIRDKTFQNPSNQAFGEAFFPADGRKAKKDGRMKSQFETGVRAARPGGHAIPTPNARCLWPERTGGSLSQDPPTRHHRLREQLMRPCHPHHSVRSSSRQAGGLGRGRWRLGCYRARFSVLNKKGGTLNSIRVDSGKGSAIIFV